MALYNTDLVVVNEYSRPATKLVAVRGIVIHWTANAGGTDTGHQSFFDGLDGGGSRYAGAHIFVDKDSAVLIIPLDEVAYHANERACKVPALKASTRYYLGGNANLTTIGIEMCVEPDGTLHRDTVARTAQITAELCKQYNLTKNNIYRHYDVTGKNCPAPWVDDPTKFSSFKEEVTNLMANVSTASTQPTFYQVIVPNTVFWQVKSLVNDYMCKGFTVYAKRVLQYGGENVPKQNDPYQLVIISTRIGAENMVAELIGRGYSLAYSEPFTNF